MWIVITELVNTQTLFYNLPHLLSCNSFLFSFSRQKYGKDEVDSGGSDLVHLLGRIRNDAGHLMMLGGKELELLSDMDPDSLGDIIQDK